MQHRRARGHRRLSRRGIGIAAEMVVEAPATDVLTQGDGFRHALRIADLSEQAVEQRQPVIHEIPAARMTLPHHCPTAINQQVGAAQERPGPDRLHLDLRIQRKRRMAGRRVAQVDGIAEFVGGEAELQSHRCLPRATLQRDLAGRDPAIDGFGAGPQRRTQPPFAGQHRRNAALCGLRQQAQRAVQAGLATAVVTGHHVQLLQRQDQPVQRTIVGDGQGLQHGRRPWEQERHIRRAQSHRPRHGVIPSAKSSTHGVDLLHAGLSPPVPPGCDRCPWPGKAPCRRAPACHPRFHLPGAGQRRC